MACNSSAEDRDSRTSAAHWPARLAPEQWGALFFFTAVGDIPEGDIHGCLLASACTRTHMRIQIMI